MKKMPALKFGLKHFKNVKMFCMIMNFYYREYITAHIN